MPSQAITPLLHPIYTTTPSLTTLALRKTSEGIKRLTSQCAQKRKQRSSEGVTVKPPTTTTPSSQSTQKKREELLTAPASSSSSSKFIQKQKPKPKPKRSQRYEMIGERTWVLSEEDGVLTVFYDDERGRESGAWGIWEYVKA